MKTSKKPLVPISRADAMRLAWEIRRKGTAFSDSIKKAWKALRLKMKLGSTDEKGVWIAYTKDKGEVRHALATRTIEHIPAQFHPKSTDTSTSNLVIKYYDIFQDGWRSFRADRLILNF